MRTKWTKPSAAPGHHKISNVALAMRKKWAIENNPIMGSGSLRDIQILCEEIERLTQLIKRPIKMNYPNAIYADTDLVCSDEPNGSHEKYIRADLVNALIEIVDGVRSEDFRANVLRLKDTPEYVNLYNASR